MSLKIKKFNKLASMYLQPDSAVHDTDATNICLYVHIVGICNNINWHDIDCKPEQGR